MKQSAQQKTNSLPTAEPLGWITVALSLSLAAFWGGNAVATRFAVDVLPPVATAAMRFGLASLFMLGWCLVEGKGIRLKRRQVLPAFVLGFLLFGQIALFNIGIWLSNASHAVLLINTAVFWVLLIEHYITFSVRITANKVWGVVIAAAGAALVLTTSSSHITASEVDSPTLAGDLVLFCSSVLLGIKIVYTRHAVHQVEPGKLIFWHDFIGLICFTLCSALTERITEVPLNLTVATALLYQGLIVGGLCFAIQARLLKKHAASKIAVFGFAAPVFGITFAQIFRHDPLSSSLLIAAVCVAVGIVMVNLEREIG